VNLGTHEKAGGRKYPVPAIRSATAQAHPIKIFGRDLNRAASGFAQVIRTMKRPSAKRTPLATYSLGHLLVFFESRTKDADFSMSFA
jgi:hypothetical protein